MNSASAHSIAELDPLKTRCLPDRACQDFPAFLVEWDTRLRERGVLSKNESPGVFEALHWLVENPWGIASIGALMAFVFWRCFRLTRVRDPKFVALRLFAFALGAGLADLTSSSLKVFFGRLKPHVISWHPLYQPALSFPSNHAFNTAFICAWAYLESRRLEERAPGRRRLFGLSLGALLVFVCYSRIALGEHYPFDVGFGALFGASFALLYSFVVRLVTSTKP